MSEQLPADNNPITPSKRFTFTKNERLCSQKVIGQLFVEGKSLFYFPFRLVYFITQQPQQPAPVRIVISVPKKAFKHAVKRNLMKRRIREAYRKHKNNFYANLPQGYVINVMLIYVSPTIVGYTEIETKLNATLNALAKRIAKDSHIPPHSIN